MLTDSLLIGGVECAPAARAVDMAEEMLRKKGIRVDWEALLRELAPVPGSVNAG